MSRRSNTRGILNLSLKSFKLIRKYKKTSQSFQKILILNKSVLVLKPKQLLSLLSIQFFISENISLEPYCKFTQAWIKVYDLISQRVCQPCNNKNKNIDKQVQVKIMLNSYNLLRQTYIVDGFDEAQQYIEELEGKNEHHQILLINFYCYINIQAKFKDQSTLEILNNCIVSPDCTGSLRALTLYHIASLYFQRQDYNNCRNTCQQLIQQFIGLYYSLEMRLEKSVQQQTLSQQLQQLIYYAFLMLSYVSKEENRHNDSTIMYEAGRRMIKNRQDVLSLTTRTTIIKTEESEQIKLYSPQVAHKKDSEKQNFRSKGFNIKHAKSTI